MILSVLGLDLTGLSRYRGQIPESGCEDQWIVLETRACSGVEIFASCYGPESKIRGVIDRAVETVAVLAVEVRTKQHSWLVEVCLYFVELAFSKVTTVCVLRMAQF